MDGKFVADHVAMLPAENRGVLYGAGCFETLRAYGGRFLHLERHIERFNRALDYLDVPVSGRLKEVEYRDVRAVTLMFRLCL